MPEPTPSPGIWCLVANVKERPYADDQSGTRHFSPGTKCYVYPPQWGDGFDRVRVLARHRGSPRLVEMVAASKWLENWRAKEVFLPFVVARMVAREGPFVWSREQAERAAVEMNRRDDEAQQKTASAP